MLICFSFYPARDGKKSKRQAGLSWWGRFACFLLHTNFFSYVIKATENIQSHIFHYNKSVGVTAPGASVP